MPPTFTILADDRERDSGIPDRLAAMDGLSVSVRRLAFGDYRVEGGFVAERKTIADLAASVVDGRLFRQAARLVSGGGPRPFLLIEGRVADAEAVGVRREALQGALITLAVIYGLPVLRALDAAESAQIIGWSARQVGRSAAGRIPRAGYRPRDPRRRRLFILQSLPRIGPERAARLLDRFGSVAGVVNADARALAAVPSIGPAIARLIVETVGPPASHPE